MAIFKTPGWFIFAASGDTGGSNIYPSTSPYVVSAGGTMIHRSSSGAFLSESGWSGSGGGPSKYEPKPSYQSGVANTSSTRRSAPDFSFDAYPHSGVSVYDSTQCQGLSGWLVFGGTSVSSPSLAGIVNLAGHFYRQQHIRVDYDLRQSHEPQRLPGYLVWHSWELQREGRLRLCHRNWQRSR